MLAPLVLPKELQGVGDKLTYAVRETATLEAWPDGQPPFVEAAQPEAIAKPLIAALHADLARAKIAYLYREEMKRRGRVRLGMAGKASAKVAYLTGFDFVIEFNWTYWTKLTAAQRIALVDHELTHCAPGPDGEGWVVLAHDVEEFSSIVQRWGLWTPDLLQFNAAAKSAQINLFADGAIVTGIHE